MGRRIEFVRIPIDEVRKNSEDFACMLEWFERVGYNVDIAALERTYDMRLTKLDAWAQKQPRAGS